MLALTNIITVLGVVLLRCKALECTSGPGGEQICPEEDDLTVSLLQKQLAVGASPILEAASATELDRAVEDTTNDTLLLDSKLPYSIEHAPLDANLHQYLRLDPGSPTMNLSRQVLNNLGGFGPDLGPPEMRFANVLTQQGKNGVKIPIDLVVVPITPYRPKKARKNGLQNGMISINFRGGSTTDFRFSFYVSGTYIPAMVDEFYFTIYDIDHASPDKPLREEVLVGHYEKAFVDKDTVLIIKNRTLVYPPRFRSNSSDRTGETNPTDPVSLTPEQRRNSISLRYRELEYFDITLSVVGGKRRSGRNFLFSGVPLFSGCARATELSALSLNKVAYSNLGFAGPCIFGGHPEGMRFKDVYTYPNGTAVDLVINALSGYKPAFPWLNGARNDLGCINLRVGSRANFSFKFVDAEDNLMAINNLMMSFLDLDGKLGDPFFKEKVIVGGFNKVIISDFSQVHIKPLPYGTDGLTQFSSTQPDLAYGHWNPVSSTSLTPEQQQRTFTVQFKQAAAFNVVMDVRGWCGLPRNIYFAGLTRLIDSEEVHYCEAD